MAATKALVPVVPEVFKKVLSLFPQQYFRLCFAYGSGVYNQGGVKVGKPMIDLIFTVEDSYGFHSQNILANPHHYSSLKRFGGRFVSLFQEKIPAFVYFNTLIPLKEEDWNHMYLAGRLHKPVKIIERPGNDLDMPLNQNILSALHAAFLILPEHFTEIDLYHTIASLSYNGDFRMIFGEDRNKVYNILEKQVLKFRELYKPFIKTMDEFVDIPDEGAIDQMCTQDFSTTTKAYHLFQLPAVPQKELVKYWKAHGGRKRRDAEDVLQDLAVNPDLGDMLSLCLRKIVFRSSLIQSAKGILTAGLLKSIKYSNSKIAKMYKSLNVSKTRGPAS